MRRLLASVKRKEKRIYTLGKQVKKLKSQQGRSGLELRTIIIRLGGIDANGE